MIIEQRVQVKFDTGEQTYTYGWLFTSPFGGQGQVPPLDVGDRVVTPGNWRNPVEQEATVVALGSDWPGPVRHLVRRADVVQGES